MSKINPYKPNSPVSPGMFAGRYKEMKTFEKGLFQTKNNQATNFLITGERGIGKSSLINIIKSVATGKVDSFDYGEFNFVPVSAVVSNHTTLGGFIRLIENCLNRELSKVEKVRSFMKETWSFILRMKVMDSGIDGRESIQDLDLIMDEFSYSLSKTCERLTNPEKDEKAHDGIVFFIDEADNASQDLNIGYFFKTITELLQRHDCSNIMFIVAGLPSVVDKLLISHESSLRVFQQLNIKELTIPDRKYVIDRGIDEGNKINADKTSITNDAKDFISRLSEGYPHFIQQFAYSAFEFNTDGEISQEDVGSGAFNSGGALDAIGDRYYRSAYIEQIKSDDYREVLSIMADNLNSWIKKKDIRENFSGADHVVTDALKALTARKIILKNPSKTGEYRLQQKGFALWIKLFGQRNK